MPRVLLVEDEISVLILAESVIQGFPQLVPQRRLSFWTILVTSICCSRTSGCRRVFDLAKAAREKAPNLKVLYTTGQSVTDGMKAMLSRAE